jgi:hypothetical protein
MFISILVPLLTYCNTVINFVVASTCSPLLPVYNKDLHVRGSQKRDTEQRKPFMNTADFT